MWLDFCRLFLWEEEAALTRRLSLHSSLGGRAQAGQEPVGLRKSAVFLMNTLWPLLSCQSHLLRRKQVLRKGWLALGRKESKTMRMVSPPTGKPMPCMIRPLQLRKE